MASSCSRCSMPVVIRCLASPFMKQQKTRGMRGSSMESWCQERTRTNLCERYHTLFSGFADFNISLNVSLKLGGRHGITFGTGHLAYLGRRYSYSHALEIRAQQSAGNLRPGLLRSFDGESGEADADIPAGPMAVDGKRDVALGHRRGMRALRGADMGGGAGVGAEHLPDVTNIGECAVPVIEFVFAEGEAAALGAERDRHGLAVVAGDRAGTGRGLVDCRPAAER